MIHLTEGLNLSQGKNYEARALLGQVAFRTGELSVALNHFQESLAKGGGGSSGFDQKKLARDYADLQWVRVEAQVNKALRGEKGAAEPDFALAEKSAKELPEFDPARDRILGEIYLLRAKYQMALFLRKEIDIKQVSASLHLATQHLRSCLGLGAAAAPGGRRIRGKPQRLAGVRRHGGALGLPTLRARAGIERSTHRPAL